MNVCAGVRFETIVPRPDVEGERVHRAGSDVNFELPVGGFYSGIRDDGEPALHEFGTTVEQSHGVGEKPHERYGTRTPRSAAS